MKRSTHILFRRSLPKLVVAKVAVMGVSILAALGSSPAHAIKCKDEYQVTLRGLVATPYCEANYLARVARSYGIRVSSRSLRWNTNKKREVCYFIGHDIRAQEICVGFRDAPFLAPW